MESKRFKLSMKCPHCAYEWQNRTKKPKECPRCKHRLDTPKVKA